MSMWWERRKVVKVGNSLMVAIPYFFADRLDIRAGERVEFGLVEGNEQLLLKKVDKKESGK